jgi:very-short-patch-repair endonuclease
VTAKPPRKPKDRETRRARRLRRDQSDAERRVWFNLRDRRLDGWKFSRQKPIGPYVVDFICREAGLVVEIDGGQHADQLAEDAARTKYLESLGYRVLRFWNNEVLLNTEGVMESILRELAVGPSPRPSPRRGEGD